MKYLLLLTTLLFTISSCTTTVPTVGPGESQPSLAPDDTTVCDLTKLPTKRCSAQCPFGQPVYRCPAHRPCTAPVVVQRAQYELGYSPDRGVPLWVCETVDPGELQGTAERKGSFSLDPLIPRAYQGSPDVYTGKGYHRGHLAAAANQKWDQHSMDQTFYISNAAPMEPEFNRSGGAWYKLEQWVRALAVKYNERVYVISGPSFFTWRSPLSKGQSTEGEIQEIHVPSHYWKVVVAKRGTKEWQVLAFTVENESKGYSGNLLDRINSVDNIEQITGLDLLPHLPPSLEEKFERKRSNPLLWDPNYTMGSD